MGKNSGPIVSASHTFLSSWKPSQNKQFKGVYPSKFLICVYNFSMTKTGRPAYEAIRDKQSAAALYFPFFSNVANLWLPLDTQNTKGWPS